ncbi:MAG: D-alanine--D-alanine ligase [Planctomycetota bacterium]|nr:D-alanine--D-alanine ligase [Planctomycetota bacterium]
MVARDRKAGRGRGDRLRVAVLMGGPSSEHEVSLQGGANVAAAMDPTRFEVRPVVITKEGAWRMAPARKKTARFQAATVGAGDSGPPPDPGFDPHDTDSWAEFDSTPEALVELRSWGADLVFPVLHGAFGEDGVVQACLHAAGLPFVGSGHRGSALAFDKVRAKEIVTANGIHTPDWAVYTASELSGNRADHVDEWVERFGLPLVLKNPLGGSSVEVRIAQDAGQVVTVLDELLPPSDSRPTDRILIERFVPGRELTAGVIEDRETREAVALPIVEICTRHADFFDYHEKYAADGAEELCPAPIDEEATEAAQQMGLAVHRLLGLRGLSRTDLRMTPDGKLHFLEVNTLPGMTSRGLVPLAAATMGIEFPQLIDRLVRLAATPS